GNMPRVGTADPESDRRGQFTVECVEPGRAPWEEELRQAQEHYFPVILDRPQTRYSITGMRRGEQNRRRRRRFSVDGKADLTLIGGHSRLEGQVQEISECGCRLLPVTCWPPEWTCGSHSIFSISA